MLVTVFDGGWAPKDARAWGRLFVIGRAGYGLIRQVDVMPCRCMWVGVIRRLSEGWKSRRRCWQNSVSHKRLPSRHDPSEP